MIILSHILRKVLFSLVPLVIMYFLKAGNNKPANNKPFFIDKDNVEEGEIIKNN